MTLSPDLHMSSLTVAEHLEDIVGVVGAPDQAPLLVLLDPASRLEPQTRDVLQLWDGLLLTK